LILPNQQNQQS